MSIYDNELEISEDTDWRHVDYDIVCELDNLDNRFDRVERTIEQLQKHLSNNEE